ncbi:MAG: DUF6482 family protein [Pseudomonadales bacterium]
MTSDIAQQENNGAVTLQALIQHSGRSAVDLVVVSSDPEFYSVEQDLDGVRLLVFDGKRPLVTRSLGAMKRALKGVRCRRASLRHVTAFDEMIGMPSAAGGALLEISIAM